jgi:DNA-binding NarL/FixJ family response regulator
VSRLALVTDLLDRSRFPADVRFVRRVPDGDGPVDLFVVDLAVGNAIEAVRELRAAGSTARIVAYGRHDDRERLAAARQAGCDRVLARSAFFADVQAALDG